MGSSAAPHFSGHWYTPKTQKTPCHTSHCWIFRSLLPHSRQSYLCPRAFKLWYKRSFHLSLVDGDAISCGKPLVVLDIVDPILEVSRTFGEVHLQEVP